MKKKPQKTNKRKKQNKKINLKQAEKDMSVFSNFFGNSNN